MRACFRRVAAVLATTLALGALLSGCSTPKAGEINYVVDGGLASYNTATVVGAASAGARAFARTLLGFGYHGPDGQVVADRDFGTVSVVSRSPLVLEYRIADEAVYSDDTPITCDDIVLAWAAQSGRFPGFDAANRAGYADIEHVDCQPGNKTARVVFSPERSGFDYQELFTATSIMPAHVISAELGIDVTQTLMRNTPDVERVAQAWNTIWDLSHNIDLSRFPSSGPYRIEAVLDTGAVVLAANERWWGAKPATGRITVWPQAVDVGDRVNERAVDVIDVATGSAGSLVPPDDYESVQTASGGIQQLIFAPHGSMSKVSARRAVALCTPRDVIARDAGVPIANSRLNTVADDAYSQAENIPQAGEFIQADPDAARETLNGSPLTVRIGYRGPNARLAAVVGAIARACEPAGITVTELASDDAGPRALREGRVDVLLASTGGATGSGSTGSSAVDAYNLHSGNGNNLSGYRNEQIDGAIAALAVTADPAEMVRLLAESAPVLWTDMPTLPLYRQQRTLLTSKKAYAVGANPTRWGAGWNMDRWALER